MKKLFYPAPFLVLVIFILSGCHRECDQVQVAALTFTQKDLSINPYTGNEILVFKDLTGDSVVLSNGMRYNDPYTRYQYDNETAKLDHHGCQGDYFTADYNRTGFNSDSGNMAGLHIDLSFPFLLDNPVSGKNFRLTFHCGTNNSGLNGDLRFDNDSLFNWPDKGDSIVAFHQQVSVGPKSFSNVYELYCHNEDTRNDEWFFTGYYSVQEGLVGVRSKFGQVWYLDRMIK